jgi:hypothetical protein
VDPAGGSPPGEVQGTLLGDAWRAIPRGWKRFGILVLAGLAAWGLWSLWDGHRRARLREEIEAVLASLPPEVPDPAPEDEENAAVLYREAFASIVFAKLDQGYYAASSGKKWTTPPKEVETALAAHTETLRLLEEALDRPAFAPGPRDLFPSGARQGSCWDLAGLASTRALVAVRAGRVREGVHYALFDSRMARQQGPGRFYPWYGDAGLSSYASLQVLREAVVDPALDAAAAREVLARCMSGEEARAAGAAQFEAVCVRYAGKNLADWLGGAGEAQARARGWRPPSLHQRLLSKLGKGPTVEPFPTTAVFRRQWDAILAARARVGLRGKEAAAALAGPLVRSSREDPYDWENQYAADLRGRFVIEAWFDIVRIAAALRLFEAEKGRAPAALDELVPGYLPSLPQDPFTGAPFLYETLPDGWRVSSEGTPGAWGCHLPWNDVMEGLTWKRPPPPK